MLQLNATGGVAARYLWGPAVDHVLAEEDGSGNVSWFLADNHGTVRNVVTYGNSQTTLANHVVYDPYGNVISGVNPGIGFAGQYWDGPAGSYYCIARWYNPSTSRYESLDPTGFSAGDANLYDYVFNDPTNLVDPTGENIAWGAIVPMLAQEWPGSYYDMDANFGDYPALQSVAPGAAPASGWGGGLIGGRTSRRGPHCGSLCAVLEGFRLFFQLRLGQVHERWRICRLTEGRRQCRSES